MLLLVDMKSYEKAIRDLLDHATEQQLAEWEASGTRRRDEVIWIATNQPTPTAGKEKP